MTAVEKYQSLIILSAVGAGLFLGQFAWIAGPAAALIVPFLMVMLSGVFLHVPLKHLRKAFLNLRFTGISLAANFLWNPVLAWGLGAYFLRDVPELWVGLIMLMVTPCTDWYLVFTSISRGNIALGSALLPWNLVLQLLLLPFYLMLLAGMLVEIDRAILLHSMLLVLAVPFAVASLSRSLVVRWKDKVWFEKRLLPVVAAGQLIFLNLAIVAVFASQGGVLVQRPEVVVKFLLPVVLFFTINFAVAQGIGRIFGLSYGEVSAFSFTILARNSPIALAIAVSAFPDRPLIALSLVIGPLIELPVLAAVSGLLLWLRSQGVWPDGSSPSGPPGSGRAQA